MAGNEPACFMAYGVRISSPIPLRGFPLTQRRPQVDVLTAPTPEHLDDAQRSGAFWSATPTAMLIDTPDLGRLFVTNGNRIAVEPGTTAARSDTFLVGVPLAACMMQRGHTVLHAAAVEVDGLGTIAFSGENGAGKSSLCYALTKLAKARPVADNLTVLGQTDWHAAVPVERGPSSFRLWEDAAIGFDLDPCAGERVKEDMAKYVFSRPTSSDPIADLAALIVLQPADVMAPVLRQLHGAEAVYAALTCHFRRKIAEVTLPNVLERASSLARGVPVYELQRPQRGVPPLALAAFIANELTGHGH